MDTFKCGGWLHITIADQSNIALAKLKHQNDHVKYWSIEVPSDIRDHVCNNSDLSPAQACSASQHILYICYSTIFQLWNDILKQDPSPVYSRRSIYRLWYEQTSKKWKHDQD